VFSVGGVQASVTFGLEGVVGVVVPVVGPDGLVPVVGPDGLVPVVGPDGLVPLVGPDGLVPLVGPDGLVPLEDPDGLVPPVDPDGLVPLADPDELAVVVDPDELPEVPPQAESATPRHPISEKQAIRYDHSPRLAFVMNPPNVRPYLLTAETGLRPFRQTGEQKARLLLAYLRPKLACGRFGNRRAKGATFARLLTAETGLRPFRLHRRSGRSRHIRGLLEGAAKLKSAVLHEAY
jgi:hypothetical protein